MLVKFVIIALMLAMLGSLGAGLFYIYRDRGHGTRAVRALTWRISIWIVLFAFLAAGIHFGFITPGNSLRPHLQ